MSPDELDRVGMIRRVAEGRLPQKQAAVMTGMTARQARRLIVAYKLEGAAALVSKKRGGREARRVARPGRLTGDAPALDAGHRPVGHTQGSGAGAPPAPFSPSRVRRAGPDRRLRASLVRTPRPHVAPTRTSGEPKNFGPLTDWRDRRLGSIPGDNQSGSRCASVEGTGPSPCETGRQ